MNVDRAGDLSDALRAALAARKPYLINANISADKNPGGAGVWELPGLGQSQPAFGGRYQPAVAARHATPPSRRASKTRVDAL